MYEDFPNEIDGWFKDSKAMRGVYDGGARVAAYYYPRHETNAEGVAVSVYEPRNSGPFYVVLENTENGVEIEGENNFLFVEEDAGETIEEAIETTKHIISNAEEIKETTVTNIRERVADAKDIIGEEFPLSNGYVEVTGFSMTDAEPFVKVTVETYETVEENGNVIEEERVSKATLDYDEFTEKYL